MAVKRGTFSGVIAQGQQSAPKPKGQRSTIPLSSILDRPHGDTRDLNPEHVAELMESIAAVGLIQPIAIDSQGHLLAGSHRRAALELLEQEQPKRYQELFSVGVSVRRFDFNAADEHDQAIAIEAAENEKRRDYTPAEVRELADRLVGAGFKETTGRPKKGEKALTPALMTIVGKSKRTIRKYLAGDSDAEQQKRVQADTILRRILKGLSQLADHSDLEEDEVTQKAIAQCRRKLEKLNLPQ